MLSKIKKHPRKHRSKCSQQKKMRYKRRFLELPDSVHMKPHADSHIQQTQEEIQILPPGLDLHIPIINRKAEKQNRNLQKQQITRVRQGNMVRCQKINQLTSPDKPQPDHNQQCGKIKAFPAVF